MIQKVAAAYPRNISHLSQSLQPCLDRSFVLAQQLLPSAVDQHSNDSRPYHPVIFEAIDAISICTAALRTNGSHNPGLDATAWRHICCSFKGSLTDLCNALAKTARRISSEIIDSDPIEVLTASCSIDLDKCPGVRSIGVCKVSPFIIAKSTLVINNDIQQVASTYQLCAGRKGGCEAAVHAMRNIAPCQQWV